MAYTYTRQLAHPSNFGGSRTANHIKYIVIHYTGNDGDKAAGNARYFQTAGRGASAHYFVDSTAVYQSVSDLNVAWSVGGPKYQDCTKTGGGKLYKVASNANSLSIEICDDNKNGKIEPSEETLQNVVALVKQLMAKYQVPLERVIRHFDVNGKHCPEYYLEEKAWSAFKSRIAPGAPTANEETAADTKAGTYKVNAPAGLNVRAGDGTKHRKLYALAKGDTFQVDKVIGDWAHGRDLLKREGYAYMKWLEKCQD